MRWRRGDVRCPHSMGAPRRTPSRSASPRSSAIPPSVIVIAGPNGAGKSTSAPWLLRDVFGVKEFVNADTIARGLSGFEPERAAMQAGRIMLARLHDLARERSTFAFETTLASRSFAPWIGGLVESGYSFSLAFLWLPSARMAVARVKDRVRKGGHDVPSHVVERRYRAGARNFFELYQPIANRWIVYDTSRGFAPLLVASGRRTTTVAVSHHDLWRDMRRLGGEAEGN